MPTILKALTISAICAAAAVAIPRIATPAELVGALFLMLAAVAAVAGDA